MFMKNLYLVRHAKARRHANFIYGSLDLEIEEPNQDAITRAQSILPLDAFWYSSPLKRAVQTAAKLLRPAELRSLEICPFLSEQHFGSLEGSNQVLPQDDTKPFWLFSRGLKPPGGESFEDVIDRARKFLDVVKNSPQDNVVAVTHGNFIRALFADIFSIPDELPSNIHVAHLGIVSLRLSSANEWSFHIT